MIRKIQKWKLAHNCNSCMEFRNVFIKKKKNSFVPCKAQLSKVSKKPELGDDYQTHKSFP